MQIDLVEMQLDIKEISKPYRYILNIIDHFSKYVWSFLQVTKLADETLENMKKLLAILPLHPKIVQSDNGGEFKNGKLKDYLNVKGVHFIHGRPESRRSREVQ